MSESKFFGGAKDNVGFKKNRLVRLTSPDARKNQTECTYTYRILPSILKQTEKEIWRMYRGQHFGYKVPSFRDPEDPEKAITKPFLCIEDRNFQTKMVTRRCGECEDIAKRRSVRDGRFNEAVAALQKKGLDDKAAKSQAKEAVKSHDAWLRQHNCDRKWHMHVKGTDGEFYTLLISNDDKKLLDMKVAQLKKNTGIDHLAHDQGVWWVFTVTGDHLDRKVDITWLTEQVQVNGESLDRVKRAPLTEKDGAKACEDLIDLSDDILQLSSEQIDLLVGCDGEPKTVEKIMGLSRATTREESAPAQSTRQPEPAAPPQAPVEAKPEAPAAEDDEEAALLRQLEVARAKKAAAAKSSPETKKSAGGEIDMSAIKDMPDDQFEQIFGEENGSGSLT